MTTAKFCAFIAPSGTLPAAEPCLARPALLRMELHRLGAVRLTFSRKCNDAPLRLGSVPLQARQHVARLAGPQSGWGGAMIAKKAGLR